MFAKWKCWTLVGFKITRRPRPSYQGVFVVKKLTPRSRRVRANAPSQPFAPLILLASFVSNAEVLRSRDPIEWHHAVAATAIQSEYLLATVCWDPCGRIGQ